MLDCILDDLALIYCVVLCMAMQSSAMQSLSALEDLRQTETVDWAEITSIKLIRKI